VAYFWESVLQLSAAFSNHHRKTEDNINDKYREYQVNVHVIIKNNIIPIDSVKGNA